MNDSSKILVEKTIVRGDEVAQNRLLSKRQVYNFSIDRIENAAKINLIGYRWSNVTKKPVHFIMPRIDYFLLKIQKSGKTHER